MPELAVTHDARSGAPCVAESHWLRRDRVPMATLCAATEGRKASARILLAAHANAAHAAHAAAHAARATWRRDMRKRARDIWPVCDVESPRRRACAIGSGALGDQEEPGVDDRALDKL